MRTMAIAVVFLCSVLAWAEDLPDCVDSNGVNLPINNAEIVRWKFSTANLFKASAHARGVVTRIFSDRTKHRHFEIQIGAGAEDTVEIVYASKFGALPALLGANVEACGVYITANAPTDHFEASPSGAIIHWVHKSKDPLSHPSGFVAVDDVAYGI